MTAASKVEMMSLAEPGPDGLVPFSFTAKGKQYTWLMEPNQLWFIEARAAMIRAKLFPVEKIHEQEEVSFG
jgi:hypothetical protein